MAKQSWTAGQVLTAQQMNDLQANDYNLTVSTKTDDYTFVAADKGTRVVANKASAIAFTVDDAIFTAGDTLQVSNINTGVLTLTAGSGVTLNGAEVLTVTQWQGGTLYFTSASSAIWFPTNKSTYSEASIGSSQSTTSTSYTDLATVGPSVTITTGTLALVLVSSFITAPAGFYGAISFAISGATTSSATDSNGLFLQAPAAGAQQISFTKLVPVSLTAGSNTFTAKYRVTGGTGTFENRSLTVIRL